MCCLSRFFGKVCSRAEEGSLNCSKKTDDACAGYPGKGSGQMRGMLKLRCIALGMDVKALLFLFMFVPVCVIVICSHGHKVSYILRPLWESSPKPFNEIPHYYNENVSMENLCKLHGWVIRDYPRRVFDAVLFSNEVDLLKIRWKELDPYVSEFVLLESNSTFTGLSKPFVFASVRDQFKFVDARLTYGQVPGRFRKGENPSVEEAYQRLALDHLLKRAGIQDGDLLIISDVNELPSGHTMNLLRWCNGIPRILHLRLRNYLYSFEYLVDDNSWRASVQIYESGMTKHARYRQSDQLLADGGWHCSFCFRHISEFIFKMKALSHFGRSQFSRTLNWKWVQRVICSGEDLFSMLPKEYTFRDIIRRIGPIPSSYSAVHLPSYLLENAEEYKFLLPGNCLRESR